MPRGRQAVLGLGKFNKKMKRFPDEIEKEIRKAIRKNADELENLSKSLVPVREGHLKRAIRRKWKHRLGIWVGIDANKDPDAFHARFVEFGTRKGTKGETASVGGRKRKVYRTHPGTDAQPFLFPAYRALRRRMKGRITRASRKAIKDVINGK